MPSLFPEPDELPPQAARLAPNLRTLAQEGLFRMDFPSSTVYPLSMKRLIAAFILLLMPL